MNMNRTLKLSASLVTTAFVLNKLRDTGATAKINAFIRDISPKETNMGFGFGGMLTNKSTQDIQESEESKKSESPTNTMRR